MTPWLSDPDVDIHVGDALEVLRGLPDGSVDCCVTSPPYWGLRDYGTGQWDGGSTDCDHTAAILTRHGGWDGNNKNPDGTARTSRYAGTAGKVAEECPCGARRVDRQLGLEATPDLYVAAMVAVFAEVRRVLADHGTLWLNIGDSYNNRVVSRPSSHQAGLGFESDDLSRSWAEQSRDGRTRLSVTDNGLKEKDLCGIPWRLAFALQADGWWLRSDIIWAKPNPMPESVTDRPTKAHEYVFLLSKRPSYWFDQEAVRERYHHGPSVDRDGESRGPWQNATEHGEARGGSRTTARGPDGRRATHVKGAVGSIQHRDGERWPSGGRNVRSVWEIATQPYPEAHFATFPEELPRRAILAGCPEWVCGVCGKARERIVDVTYEKGGSGGPSGKIGDARGMVQALPERMTKHSETLGWSDCGHNAYRPGTVLDPFLGSGTTAHVARKHGRRCVGIELNETYAELAARRLQQLSLLAEGGIA